MSNEKLLPCPFCGGEAKIYFLKKEHPFVYRVACTGFCKTAYGFSYSYSEEQSAIDAWNNRADTELKELLKEAVKLIKRSKLCLSDTFCLECPDGCEHERFLSKVKGVIG